MAEERVNGVVNWERMYTGRMQGGMVWPSALSELFDNALDAKRTGVHPVITADFYPRRFVIDDNGKGSKTLDPFFGFGTHEEHDDGRGGDALGVYGVGGTHAILYISKDIKTQVAITSKHKGTVRSIDITWQRLASLFNRREAAPASSEPVESDGGSGCRIELSGNIRETPHGAEFDELASDLAFRYSKAIEEGAKIILQRYGKRGLIKPIVLAPPSPPDLVNVVRDEFDVNGKRVRLMVGMLPQGTFHRRIGLHYRYSYRVVRESTDDGCGGYPTGRIFGFIDLLHGWRLDLHKDGITDKDAKQLYAEVFRRIEPLLKSAQNQLMVAESRALITSVEKLLNEAIGKTKKAKRGKGKKRGSQEPTGNGTEHSDAENKQPGDRMYGDGGRGTVHIEFVELDSALPGELRAGTIRLNLRVDLIRRARDTSNADAIFSTAMFVYGLEKTFLGHFDMREVQEAMRLVGLAMSSAAAPTLDGKRLANSTEAA